MAKQRSLNACYSEVNVRARQYSLILTSCCSFGCFEERSWIWVVRRVSWGSTHALDWPRMAGHCVGRHFRPWIASFYVSEAHKTRLRCNRALRSLFVTPEFDRSTIVEMMGVVSNVRQNRHQGITCARLNVIKPTSTAKRPVRGEKSFRIRQLMQYFRNVDCANYSAMHRDMGFSVWFLN